MLTKNDKYNIKIIIIPHIITIPTSTTNIQIDHFKTTLHILNTLSKYKHIHCKTTFMCPGGKVHCGSAFESGASGSTHYFTPPVYVPDGIGAQTVWRHNNQKKNGYKDFWGLYSHSDQGSKLKQKQVCAFVIHFMVHCGSAFERGTSGLPYYYTSICVRSCCNWRASCVDSTTG